ncbi:MAG TPA: bifunctional precorrin-2 dehydrogenase/sirohydrochlorin ferrochelatase [Acidimicrobiales bacterium]|nr:bifunctional precorrin-2 dehydrogenase/sirohydrochlorin ferrochelatase [Acidimicrobiales bacterium]
MIDSPLYPVNLVLAGRRCLVVGGGNVAARKIEGLVACGAAVTVIAPDVVAEIDAQPGLRVERRRFAPGDCAGHWLVVVATDDPMVNAAVAEDATSAGIWVNAADDPDNCSLTLPAVHRRGDLTVAVATGGRSPAVASWIRDRVAAMLGPDIDELLAVVAEVRTELQAAGRPTEGLGWRQALDSDMLALIRSGQTDAARNRLRQLIHSPVSEPSPITRTAHVVP